MAVSYEMPAASTFPRCIHASERALIVTQRTMTSSRMDITLGGMYSLPVMPGTEYSFNYRDYIVGNITGSAIPTSSLSTADLQYSGTSSSEGYTYKTDVTYTSGLLTNTSVGINHNVTVAIDGVTNAVDGLVAVLDVSITTRPDNESSSGDSGAGSRYVVAVISFSVFSLMSKQRRQ